MDIRKVQKLVEMLSSDFDGERAVAACKITEIAKSERKSITELFESVFAKTVFQERVVYVEAEAKPKPQSASKIMELERVIEICKTKYKKDAMSFVTAWEREFVTDITARGVRFVSKKQEVIIDRIINKIKIGARS